MRTLPVFTAIKRTGREKNMTGTLYLCATPIGNLDDITFRVLETLRSVDVIAAEDTRNSIKLLNRFEIKTPMTSYHEFNKYDKGRQLIEQLLSGKNIAVITDAGMPGISDPGEELVKMAYEAGVPVTVLPGACACVTALTLSGLPTRRFCFEAFLPSAKKERREILEELKTETRTIVLYEAPHRLARTLAELLETLGERRITVCRELTKKHEDVFLTTLSAAAAHYRENEAKGECVLVLEGVDRNDLLCAEQEAYAELDLEEHMQRYLSEGMSRKEAMKAVAADRGLSKREIYAMLLEKE